MNEIKDILENRLEMETNNQIMGILSDIEKFHLNALKDRIASMKSEKEVDAEVLKTVLDTFIRFLEQARRWREAITTEANELSKDCREVKETAYKHYKKLAKGLFPSTKEIRIWADKMADRAVNDHLRTHIDNKKQLGQNDFPDSGLLEIVLSLLNQSTVGIEALRVVKKKGTPHGTLGR
nr:hypothetical protein 5 [bacterium]